MTYYNSLRYELEDLEDKSKLFEILTNKNNFRHEPAWEDILRKVKDYYEIYNRGEWQKHIVSKESLKDLEDIGIDYNYIDSFGLNFLHYALTSKNYPGSSFLNFSGTAAIHYIMSKTTDIAHLSNGGENILFYYTKPSMSYEKNFDHLCTKYPQLNIHQVTNTGNNLVTAALMDHNLELAKHLVDKNVSVQGIDSQGSNILHRFLFLGSGKESKALFASLIKEVDISHTNNRQENLLETWCRWLTDDTLPDQTTRLTWLVFSANKISQGEFLYDEKSLDRLTNSLDKCCSIIASASTHKDLLGLLKEASSTAHYLKLQMTVPAKDKMVKKVKI